MNEARRECRLNQQCQAKAVSFYLVQAHQRMGTETDETSGRALKLDCLKQSSSSHDAESVENVVSKRFVSSM